MRLLLGRAAIEDRPIRFIGSRRLAIRPLRPLAGVLEAAGATVDLPAPPRTLPAMIRGPIRAGRYRLDSSTSSQFLSSLLMVLPTLDRASAVSLEGGLVSLPYVEATEALLAFHGIRVERRGSRVEIPGAQSYRGRTFRIPGDASSAAYLWAAAAITGGSVTVRGLDLRWPQADLRILALLESGGSRVRRNRDDVTVEGPLGGGLDADLRAAPDLFPLVAVLAAAVPSKSWIRGSPNLRQKESDRLSGAARLCRAMGASVQLRGPSLEVSGSRQPRALRLADSDDHRIVMSAAVAALRAEKPSQIGDSTAVRKSYPGFWHDLRALGAGLSRRP